MHLLRYSSTKRSTSQQKMARRGGSDEEVYKRNIRKATSEERMQITKKFFTIWRQTCHKTKNRLMRTISWKGRSEQNLVSSLKQAPGWSVHVWTTWVGRASLCEPENQNSLTQLSQIQDKKLSHFFKFVLDTDKDEIVTVEDFEYFSQRLAHFSDWSESSTESSLLKQVQEGFISAFFTKSNESNVVKTRIELHEWIYGWRILLSNAKNLCDLPFWLQNFARILFHVINRSGSGMISRDEFSKFQNSIVPTCCNDEFIKSTYNTMTANENIKMTYSVFELCFGNWIFGRNPNGPGQWLFGECGNMESCFPIDYSAMNTPANELELYSPLSKSNRISVIV